MKLCVPQKVNELKTYILVFRLPLLVPAREVERIGFGHRSVQVFWVDSKARRVVFDERKASDQTLVDFRVLFKVRSNGADRVLVLLTL
jgi:hypothetical protein